MVEKNLVEYDWNVEKDIRMKFEHNEVPIIFNDENITITNQNSQQNIAKILDFILNN